MRSTTSMMAVRTTMTMTAIFQRKTSGYFRFSVIRSCYFYDYFYCDVSFIVGDYINIMIWVKIW